MTVDRHLVNWGIFLVLLGGIPLAVSEHWLTASNVANAWQLWPLVLVGAGLGLILARTRLAFVGGIVIAATAGLVGGGLIAAPPSLTALGCGDVASGGAAIVDRTGTLDGGATVTMRASCATVATTTVDGTGWHVLVNGPADAAPAVSGQGGSLAVTSPDRAFEPFSGGRTNWNVTLPRSQRLNLSVSINAGDGMIDLAGAVLDRLSFDANALGHTRLDLSGATAASLDVQVNAADLVVVLPTASDLTGTIEGNAATIRLCSVGGTGLRLRGNGGITANLDFGGFGLVRTGDTWESPGFASAAHHIDLATTGNAINYRLTSVEGCE